MTSQIDPPIPYSGGKRHITDLVWKRFGRLSTYIEPFCGSCAMLLGNPYDTKREIVNDINGFLVNFWRGIKYAPQDTLEASEWMQSELDLNARQEYMHDVRDDLEDKLKDDPKYYDAELAGWYAWGVSTSIGDNFIKQERSKPAIGNRRGVNGQTFEPVSEFQALFDRMKDVNILCGDWKRVFTDCFFSDGNDEFVPIGVFLDPPYKDDDRNPYGIDHEHIADDVEQWCRNHQHEEGVRIALCGHPGDYDLPGWDHLSWSRRGYDRIAEESSSTEEVVMFSPNCLDPDERDQTLPFLTS